MNACVLCMRMRAYVFEWNCNLNSDCIFHIFEFGMSDRCCFCIICILVCRCWRFTFVPSHPGWRPSVMDMFFGSVAYLYACVCFMHAFARLFVRVEL